MSLPVRTKRKSPRKSTGVGKAKPAFVRPWTTGDFLLKKGYGDLYKVGKVTKKGFETLSSWKSGEWSHSHTYDWSDKEIKRYTKLEKTIEEYEADLIRELQTDFASFESGPVATTTEVAINSGKEQAAAAKQALERTTQKLQILESLMERKKNQLRSLQHHFSEQLEKITKVVNIIELYLGVSEEIVQIAEGEPAPATEPLALRQLCLHMDEEAADIFTGQVNKRGKHTDDIDFTNIDKFDDWVRTHYKQLIPEAKGVVVCRPRRTAKDYRLGDEPLDAFTESEMNKENFRTYYLLRNGKNLYRISSDKIHIYPVLFPSKEEFKELSTPDEDGGLSDKQKEKLLSYQRNVLMLQGLIDRTNVFKPMSDGVNLLQPETYGGSVRFIHDAESLLGNGRPDFWKWLEALNLKTQRGDRVYFTRFGWDEFGRDRDDWTLLQRFPIPGWHHHRPEQGVYNIVRIEPYNRRYHSDKVSFICHFNPKDEVYKRRSYWRNSSVTERKMSIPFRLFPSDHMVINYEHINREDVEFYLQDRVNRHHYLTMVPIIRGILKAKDEEKVWEDNFVRFICGQFKRKDKDFIQIIQAAILWWKSRVIDKRPLRREDAKAVRMITARIRQQLK